MQHDAKLDYNPLLHLPDSKGVVVKPLDDLGAEESQALAQALTKALHDANIPASTSSGNAESLVLDGTVIAAAGRLREIAFALREPDGRPIGGYQVMVAFPAGPLAKPDDWADPAASVAAAVARMMQPRELAASPPPQRAPAPAAAAGAVTRGPAAPKAATPSAAAPSAATPNAATPAPSAPAWRVRLKEMKGPSDDRSRAVARALELSLRRARWAVADASSKPEEVIGVTGEVTLGPPTGAQRRVTIRWAVSDPGGRQLGTIDQANDIPNEMVERGWGEIAAAIGEGAVVGIVDLVQRTLGPAPKAEGKPAARTFTGR